MNICRKKNELEGHLRRLEGAAGDHKLLLEGQRKEVMSLSEALAKQQVHAVCVYACVVMLAKQIIIFIAQVENVGASKENYTRLIFIFKHFFLIDFAYYSLRNTN